MAATDRVLDRMDGPVILVGHSYGGAVISEAGDHDKVVGLVYVEAFMPDVGESVFGLIPQDPNTPPPFDFTADGYAFFTERPMSRALPIRCRRPMPSSCATRRCRSRSTMPAPSR